MGMMVTLRVLGLYLFQTAPLVIVSWVKAAPSPPHRLQEDGDDQPPRGNHCLLGGIWVKTLELLLGLIYTCHGILHGTLRGVS